MDNNKKYKLILEDGREFSFVSKKALMIKVKKTKNIKFIFRQVFDKKLLKDDFFSHDPYNRTFYLSNGKIER